MRMHIFPQLFLLFFGFDIGTNLLFFSLKILVIHYKKMRCSMCANRSEHENIE